MDYRLRLVFIGGTGRSGTSITREMLGLAKGVATLPFEHRMLIDPDGPIDFLQLLSSYQDPFKIDVSLKRVFAHLRALDRNNYFLSVADGLVRATGLKRSTITLSKYSGWRLSNTFRNYRDAVDQFERELEKSKYIASWVGSPSYKIKSEMRYISVEERSEFILALRNFYHSVVGAYLADKGKDTFVEDSTWNLNSAPSLLEVFPTSKLVHVFRDPRDVVASFTTQRWMPSDIRLAVKIYKNIINDIVAKTSKAPQFYPLKLENLIRNKKTEVASLCDFLEIELTPKIVNFDLSSGSLGRFRRDFDANTVNFLNQELMEEMTLLGYEA